MGFYLRKSISVGPFRFNLSKSGIGVSGGIRGLRLGAGPRGNYVHMGRHGIYYRSTIPVVPRSRTPQRQRLSDPEIPSNSQEALQEIESADVSQIVDSSSEDLLREINEKRQKVRLWPWTLVGTALLLLFAARATWPDWSIAVLAIAGSIAVYLVSRRDVVARTVVLFYEFDREMEEAYGVLHKSAEQLASCAKAWHIEAEGAVRDRKYHAGASSLVRRKATSITKAEPPLVKTNIETVALGVGRQTLHFFPDRLLVYEHNGVGAVSYKKLDLSIQPSRFIESEGLPSDAKVVDHTWRYVNKSGGPDRRFKDNPQLPICLYDEITLTSPTGLNEVVQISRLGVAEGFAKAIRYLADRLPGESSGTDPQKARASR